VAEATWRESFPFTSFDVVVDSSDVGLRKPDPRIYAELLHRSDTTAQQLIFIDDLPENVDAATDLGINGHRFTDIDGLRSYLKEFGVLA
jgi:HAD superfamily hydrolase (TIGR01509 family)